MIRRASAFITVQVPRYEQQVETQALRTTRAQTPGADTFGAGLGAGISQVGKVTMAVVADEIGKADRTAVISSRTALDQAETDLLYDPKNGALAKRGKETFGLPEPTLKTFDERAAEIEKGLARQEQKDAFRLVAQGRRVEVDKQLQRHVFGEMKTYSDEANKAALESSINSISTHYQDPARVDQELKYGQAVIMSDTEMKGKPPEFVKLRMDVWRSKVHETIIDKLMVDNAVTAQTYFETNRDSFLPTEAAKIEKILKPLATKQIGMDTALELAPQLGVKPLTEVLADVRTRLKANPDALNLAETQLKQMEVERRDQVKQVQEQAAAPVYRRIAEIQGSGRAAKLSDIPPAEWATLVKTHPEEAGKIQDALRREVQGEEDRRERKLDRAERKEDRRESRLERDERKAERGTMNQLMNWAALNGDPVSLANANLDKMYVSGVLGKEHYKSLSAKQAELKADPEKGTAIRSEAQTIEDVLGAGKIKKGTDEHSLAWNYVEERKKAYVKESGKQPTRKELETFSREALYQVDVEGSVFDRPAYKVDFSEIPAKERQKITDAFARRGRVYTQADVVQAYTRAQMNKGAK